MKKHICTFKSAIYNIIMFNSESFYKLFYYLSLNEEYTSSNELSKKLGLSIRTVKNQVQSMGAFLANNGCHLDSKRHYGYKLVIDDKDLFNKSKEEITSYIKYSHSYKDVLNEMFSFITKNIIFTNNSFSIEDIADYLFIVPSAAKKHFFSFVEQLETFDLKISNEKDRYKISGREKDLRLFAKDYLVIHLTEILNHEYDFNQIAWSDPKISFYEINNIIQKTLHNYDVCLFEVGMYRISCYFYITCHRLKNTIDIKMDRVSKYISPIDYKIANDILDRVKLKYVFLDFNETEITSLALNIMCERDYTAKDIDNHTITNKLLEDSKKLYSSIISYENMGIFKLFPKDEIGVWLISLVARIIASNHKQNKPYFFYNDKSVYYSSFSFFLARLLASCIKKYGFLNNSSSGPTLNIYCISYLTNMIYTNLMLVNPPCKKINIGIYSFLGNLTSYSLLKAIKNSSLNNYIDNVSIIEPNQNKYDMDLIFYHQETERSKRADNSNQLGFSSQNFIDPDVIYAIKAKYLHSSNYQKYLNIIDNIKIIKTNDSTSFHQIIEKYDIYQVIKEKFQVIFHDNSNTAFLFIKENSKPILDVYLLKKRFSYNNHRIKQLYVISTKLTSNDVMYYKTLEALSQIFSRNNQIVADNHNLTTLKQVISKEVEKYLVETLI